MSIVQRRLLISVLAVTKRPRLTLLLIFIGLAAALSLAFLRLNISSDENKLFSAKVPFFHNYLDFIEKFPENEAVYLVIEPLNPTDQPPIDRWTAVADRVTDRMNQLRKYVIGAQCRIPLDQLGRQGILFQDPKKLPAEFDDAKQFALLAANLQLGLFGRTPIERLLTAAALHADAQTADFISLLAHSWTQNIASDSAPVHVPDLTQINATPQRLGYFYVPNELDHSRYRILVRVYPVRNFDSLNYATTTVDAIRDAAQDAGSSFPEFHIGVTGRPALDADQMRTNDSDSKRAETIALAAVFVGLVVMLRSWWLAAAAELALGVAIGWTLGWATISLGELNLLSLVFFIALIGIGMDYLVQILSRYRVETRRYTRPGAVWVRVFRHVGPPINTACLGAAGAFLVSVFTDFKGAADLGIIAGGGLLLCLLAGYTFLPALLTLLPPRLKAYQASARYSSLHAPGGKEMLIAPALWIAATIAMTPFISRTYFNSGLIDLQVQKLESVQLVRTLQTWCAVVLSRDLDKLRQVRDVVNKLPMVESTESAVEAQDNSKWLADHASQIPQIDWTPPAPITPADFPILAAKARDLANRLAASAGPAGKNAADVLSQFAAALDSAATDAAKISRASRLSAWQDSFAKELQIILDGLRPVPLNMSQVPPSLRDHLLSSDGTYALYIYPQKDLWIEANLTQFMTSVEASVATVPDAPPVTGIASNVFHTTAAIHHAFYQATFYAFVLIFILVLLDFRRLGPTLAAISVLGIGLPMLVAMMGVVGASWNFANFFGLPILIGAGHEYGVFMVHRYLEARENPRRVWTRWDVSDRALLLCAFVTSSSFGFFWLLAEHQGLRSLGLVMALGTACIYLATLLVLRPILRWKLDSIRKKQNPAAKEITPIHP